MEGSFGDEVSQVLLIQWQKHKDTWLIKSLLDMTQPAVNPESS